MPSAAQQQNQLFAARNRRVGKPRRYFITVSQSQKSLSLRIAQWQSAYQPIRPRNHLLAAFAPRASRKISDTPPSGHDEASI